MTIIHNNFDARIKDLSDIQSFKQYDDKYVGKTGYFSDSMCRFQNLKDCTKDTLLGISTEDVSGDFIFEAESGNYRYFIPKELVKTSEKNYKVFSLEKFLETFKVGDVICYRKKGSTEVHHKMLTGYIVYGGKYDIPGIGRVTLGANTYGLGYLFDTYELFLNGKWQPFGIEE